MDLGSLQGTGPEGRILADDVERAAAGVTGAPAAVPAAAPAPLPPGEVEVVPLTSIRKTIARRLTEAWTAPVFQLGVSADMTEVLSLREQLVSRLAEGDAKPTVNDVLVKLAGVALMRHVPVNATFTGEEIQRHPNAHIGIAVAAPQGLVVPVVRDADRRTVQEIARARADLVTRARDSKLTLQDMEGGTFTISNLGMFGVEQFTAVLNPPQVAILAVGAVKDEPVVRDGDAGRRPDPPDDADLRPPRDRRRGRCAVPADARRIDRAARPGAVSADESADTTSVVVRRGGPQDVRFLRDMLHHAYYWKERAPDTGPGPVALYVKAWGRRGDTAVIALDKGFPVGAAWYRLFDRERPGYGFVDERTPELAIAVVPNARGKGVGSALLDALLGQARADGYPTISLSVDRANAGAIELYERYGFERVGEDDDSVTMRASLA